MAQSSASAAVARRRVTRQSESLGVGSPLGMVVGKDDPGASVRGGVGDDLAQRKVGTGLVAAMPGQVKASCLVVDMRDPQALEPWIGIREATGKERLGGVETVELQRVFGTLIPHGKELSAPAAVPTMWIASTPVRLLAP